MIWEIYENEWWIFPSVERILYKSRMTKSHVGLYCSITRMYSL